MDDASKKLLRYDALPTLKRFHLSDSHCRCVMGPVGSGKSSGCIFGEPLLRGIRQEPDAEGVRRTKGVMIRNTYQQLNDTTLQTFQAWWGFDICSYVSGKEMKSRIRFPLPDGTKVEIDVLFLALDKPEDASKVRSLEITWAYLNEASELPYEICDALLERVGRYPKQWRDPATGELVGGPTWSGVWMDTNAPDDEHWIYRKFEIEKPVIRDEDGNEVGPWEIFHQPPAVLLAPGSTPENPVWVPNKGQNEGIPPAENIEHLGKKGHGWDYYLNMLAGKDYEQVRVMLCGEYGTIAYGRPVFPHYKDALFYAPSKKDAEGRDRDVEVLGGLPLVIGYDPGFQYAAAVICQVSPLRQLRAIEEFILKETGTDEFAQRLLMKLRTEYRSMPFQVISDPAGLQHSRGNARTDLDIFLANGLPTVPCPTNVFKTRCESLEWFMNQRVESDAALLIGSKCPTVRKGLAGRYYFKKISTSGKDELYKSEPVKNPFSHPCEALGYVATALLVSPEAREAAMRATGSGFGSVYAEETKPLAAGIDGAGIF